MSGTFGLVPQKSRPKRERGIVSFQTRNGIEMPFGATRRQRVTQDAEGNIALTEGDAFYLVHGAIGPVFHPRSLWRLADE